MIKQTWNINDDEKNRILNLHENATKNLYLVNEQLAPSKINTNTSKTTFPSQNIGDKFAFGEYDSQNVKNNILALKPKIEEFIKNSGGNQFVVDISSGESNVTNPKGFETKGSLGLARANSVKKYFQEIFSDLIKQGVLIINTPKSESEVAIGKTPYDKTKGDNKNPELVKKYKEEQFVTFDIKGSGQTTGKGSVCNTNIDGEGKQGYSKSNYVTTNEPLDGNGDLVLTTGSIPDRMVIYNEQKQIVKDTGYVATEPHRYTSFKYVPLYVSQLTTLNGTVAVSGNKLVVIEVQSFEELMKQLLVDPNKIPTNVELTRMGGEVSSGVINLKKLFDSGIRKFVLYTIINGASVLPFDGGTGDKSVVVMSPIGNTGYQIKGKC
jgi:hypothetical protein